ncbi:hypothetical protein LWI29_022144 [Acer saccharum]|uniref:BED-type domain-containing protein n=1 Tax=Acer saccharum TaxID=4024 RepID=A0AA39TLZ1_ACESA|nr:hypothetical protein LWI29_022144 [Acer saccharum]
MWAMIFLDEWNLTHHANSPISNSVAQVPKWRPPEEGSWKINNDATTCYKNQIIGLGTIIRDESGKVKIVVAHKLKAMFSPPPWWFGKVFSWLWSQALCLFKLKQIPSKWSSWLIKVCLPLVKSLPFLSRFLVVLFPMFPGKEGTQKRAGTNPPSRERNHCLLRTPTPLEVADKFLPKGKLIMNNPYDDDGVDSSKCLGQKMSDAANSFEPTGNANRAETESALNDHAPLWKYVTKLEKMGRGGGNTSFQCNFCQQIYKGSYSRVKSHLLKIKGGGIASCSKVTNATLSEIHKVVEKAEFRVKQSLPRRVPLPTTSSSKTIGSSIGSTYCGLDLPSLGPKKRKGMSGPIEKAFNIGDKEQLDSEIARMFYTSGLSFNLARNPHYVRAFEIACSNSISGYLPPDYNSLKTTLLQKEKSNIERLLEPIKKTWQDKGVSVCSDGWSDSQRKPLINIMVVSPIYEMLRMANNDTPCLHLVYEWWVSMIEKVKLAIFRKERKQLHEESKFFDVVHGILVEQWTESSTPLHCLAHSLNPRYYSNKWLKEAPGRVAPHQDFKIARERKKCLERYFSNEGERRSFNNEYAEFSLYLEDFSSGDSMMDRDFMAPATWWAVHGASTPTLQSIALKLLGQPCSSLSCERNWSTYNFIHSFKEEQDNTTKR